MAGCPHLGSIFSKRQQCKGKKIMILEIREMAVSDWTDVRRIYQQGMDTNSATFVAPVRHMRNGTEPICEFADSS